MLTSIYLIGILYLYEMFIILMVNINNNNYFIICTSLQGCREVTGPFLPPTMLLILIKIQ